MCAGCGGSGVCGIRYAVMGVGCWAREVLGGLQQFQTGRPLTPQTMQEQARDTTRCAASPASQTGGGGRADQAAAAQPLHPGLSSHSLSGTFANSAA